jgi:hypothetical protein
MTARKINPLNRYTTKESVALYLQRDVGDLYRVDCWPGVVHVVGKGVSTFVSYADLPPIVGVETPSARDTLLWRKRWRKHGSIAPAFWKDFYATKIRATTDLTVLQAWDEIIAKIGFGLPETTRKYLEGVCAEVTRQAILVA